MQNELTQCFGIIKIIEVSNLSFFDDYKTLESAINHFHINLSKCTIWNLNNQSIAQSNISIMQGISDNISLLIQNHLRMNLLSLTSTFEVIFYI